MGIMVTSCSCKEPVEPLTLEEIADRCHALEDVRTISFHQPAIYSFIYIADHPLIFQIEMIYKIIAHMAANDRALIAEGNCGSPRSIKVFLGECNVDELYA